MIVRIFFVPAILIAMPVNGLTGTEDQFFNDNPDQPWHIVADEINYDDKAKQFRATGNVSMTKNDKKLTADDVRFDHKTMKVTATGHVILTAGDDILIGDNMEMDLESETGTVLNGTIFIKENNFYLKGRKIQKVGKHMYTVDKASISTCDTDTPAWKITGSNLKVTLEGYGVVKHAALWAKKVPVMYTPFLVFPVKLKRQSGLLPPQFGHSDRKGVQYFQPFYWTINRSSDATFYEHYMDRRGDKLGLEYRYVLDKTSKGTMMIDVLEDRKIDDGTPDSSQNWGYSDDAVPRPNSDRYWFRMKHDQAVPFGFSAKMDIDIVSDQDYLPEFIDGYTGFNQTEAYFYKNFGRTFNDYDDPVRFSSLNLSKSWTEYSLNAEIHWNDDVIARRQQDTNTTLQQLPLVEFFAAKQQMLTTPFYFDMDSQYTHFYREDGTRGHRVDIHPRLYLPYRWKNFFTIEPSFGVRETAWQIDAYENTSLQKGRRFHREIFDLKLDMSSDIFKIYRPKNKDVSRIKHAIRPQIVFDYVPEKNQHTYPWFDAIDRIERKNLLTYSIINTFTLKSKTTSGKKENAPIETAPVKKNEQPHNYKYHQFCRFKLEQSYDMNESNEDDPAKWANQTTREPFSPVYGEIELAPSRFFSLQADAQWCPYESKFQSRNASLIITDSRGDRAFVEHRFTRDSSESIYSNFLLHVSDRLRVHADYERNLHDGRNIKLGLGLLYQSQCWSIDLRYTDEIGDRKYAFVVNLFGLGGFGSRY